MFKNTVFKVSVNTKKWIKATVIRCVRTFAATMVSSLPATAATIGSVNWKVALSTSLLASVVIFFSCLAGVPEVQTKEGE